MVVRPEHSRLLVPHGGKLVIDIFNGDHLSKLHVHRGDDSPLVIAEGSEHEVRTLALDILREVVFLGRKD